VRFSKLTDEEVLARLMTVVEKEKVTYVPKGLEAIVFTADGDMRQGLNNLQSTALGFGMVNEENVFKVCDQPHPNIIRDAFAFVLQGNIDDAYARCLSLHEQGYSVFDIIGTMYRVCKNYDDNAMPEFIKLEMIRLIGFTHLRLAEGCATFMQIAGCLAKMTQLVMDAKKSGGYSSELGINVL
jgi:replication factor C subunit 2/4